MGLPVAPLTVIVLYMVGYTPSAAGREQSYLLYMACLVGVLVGLGITLVILRRVNWPARMLAGVYVGLLELSWVLLTVGLRQGRPELTVVGVVLASASCAGLAVLWLLLVIGGDAYVELGGCAVALLVGVYHLRPGDHDAPDGLGHLCTAIAHGCAAGSGPGGEAPQRGPKVAAAIWANRA